MATSAPMKAKAEQAAVVQPERHCCDQLAVVVVVIIISMMCPARQYLYLLLFIGGSCGLS